ncbi:unnamed protein product [Closterium sp. Naga37s-1]|nr:unnamed protein product [Closterium sp. Naga37s-1]
MGQPEPAPACGALQGREECPSGSATAPGPQACLRRSPRLQIQRASAASGPGQPRQAVPQQQRLPPRAQPARAPGAPRAGTGAADLHQREANTTPQTRRHQRPPPQQAEPVASEDALQGRAPTQRVQRPLGCEPEEGVRRQAADSRGAQAGVEPQGPARRASNCSGSATPSPRVPPSTPPAEDLPSSPAGGTPHHHRARGNPSSPPDHRGEQASEAAAGNAVENHGGDETTGDPGVAQGNEDETGGGQVTGVVTAGLPGPSVPQQARTDPPLRAQPREPGRQWWRTPPAATAQRRGSPQGVQQRQVAQQERRGETAQRREQTTQVAQDRDQGQEQTVLQQREGVQEEQPDRTEQQQGQTGRTRERQGEPRVRGEESFQRLLTRASEPAVEGA